MKYLYILVLIAILFIRFSITSPELITNMESEEVTQYIQGLIFISNLFVDIF